MRKDNANHRNKDYALSMVKAYAYYLKGLNASEISKLLNVSPRTVQRYIKEQQINNPFLTKGPKALILRLYHEGYTRQQIAHITGKCRTTIYNHLRGA